jgi:hypothetical protein
MKWSMMWNHHREVFVMLMMKREGWARRILNQLLLWSILMKCPPSY